jgi:hypothetical protein
MESKRIVLIVGAPTSSLAALSMLFENCKVVHTDNLENATSTPCHTVLLYGSERPERWDRVGVQLLHLDPTPQRGELLHMFVLDGQWKRACVFPPQPQTQDDINWTTIQLAKTYRGRIIRRTPTKHPYAEFHREFTAQMAKRQMC